MHISREKGKTYISLSQRTLKPLGATIRAVYSTQSLLEYTLKHPHMCPFPKSCENTSYEALRYALLGMKTLEPTVKEG